MIVSNSELAPPRCLLAVKADRADPANSTTFATLFANDEEVAKSQVAHESFKPDSPFVSVRDELVVWQLACSCGGKTGKLFGVRKDDLFVGPVRFECAQCKKSVVIFNPLEDGWNADFAKKKRKARKPPQITYAMPCRSCKKTNWKPVALVTYQGDNYSSIPPERWQDYFDVISLGGTCVECDTPGLGFSEECA